MAEENANNWPRNCPICGAGIQWSQGEYEEHLAGHAVACHYDEGLGEEIDASKGQLSWDIKNLHQMVWKCKICDRLFEVYDSYEDALEHVRHTPGHLEKLVCEAVLSRGEL